MPQITFPYAPGFADVPDSALAAEQYAMGVHLGRIVENAAMGMVRPEVFVTKQINGDTVPLPVSPVDGYVYSRNELIYMWGIHNLVNPKTGVVSDDWLNFWFGQWFVNQDTGKVTIEKWESRNDAAHKTQTNDGELFVYTIAQRRKTTMYMAAQPYYTEHEDGDLDGDNAYVETLLKDLSRNSKFGIVNTEAFYCGTYKSLQRVALPVSPVDGYQYSQDEVTWLWSWVWTTSGDAYIGPMGNLCQLDRLKASVDADGTVHTNIRYRQDSQIDMGDSMGRIAVTAICQRGARKVTTLSGTPSGHVTLTSSGPFASSWSVRWKNFSQPNLPHDAVLKKICACVIGSTNTSTNGTICQLGCAHNWGLAGGDTGLTTIFSRPASPAAQHSTLVSNADSGDTPDVSYLDGLNFVAEIWQSLLGSGLDCFVDVTSMGVAFIYESASPVIETGKGGLVSPVSLASNQGIAWCYPTGFDYVHDVGATNGTATAAACSYTTEAIQLSDLHIADGDQFAWLNTDDLAAGKPSRTDLLVQLNKNLREAVCRPEFFDAGQFTHGQTVPLPVSLIDGYEYSRDEIVYLFEMGDTGDNLSGMIRILSWDAYIDPATGLVSITEMHRRDGGHIAYDNEGKLTVKVMAIRGNVVSVPTSSPSNTDSTGTSNTGSGGVTNGGLDNFGGTGQKIADGWWAVDTAGDYDFAEEPGISPVGSSQGIIIGAPGAGNTAGMRNARSAVYKGDHYMFLFRALASAAITTGFKARLRFWDLDAVNSVYADLVSGALDTSVMNKDIEVTIPAYGDSELNTSDGVIALSGALGFDPAWVDIEFHVDAPNVACTVSIDDVDWYRVVDDANAQLHTIGLTIDGGGSAITTGFKWSTPKLPFAGTIIGWEIVETSGNSGSIAVEVDKHSGAVPNTTTDKISASAPIALSNSSIASGDASAVSTWTAAVAVGDCIGFNVASASTVQRVTLIIKVQES